MKLTPLAPSFSRHLVTACLFILLLCFALYDALFYSSLRRDARLQMLSEAALSASVLNAKISAGLRLGKDLNRFAGLERLLFQAKTGLPQDSVITVQDRDAHTLVSSSEKILSDPLFFSAPILDNQGKEQGRVRIALPNSPFEEAIRLSMLQCLSVQAALMAIALLMGRTRTFTQVLQSGKPQKVLAFCLGFMLILLSVSALHSIQIGRKYTVQAAHNTARHIGLVLGNDLNKLLLVGAFLGGAGDMDDYLWKMSAHTPNRSVVLSILDASGQVQWSSHPRDTLLAEGFSFHIPLAERTLSVGMTLSVWQIALRAMILNALTLLVIALMIMLEGYLLLFYLTGSDSTPEKMHSRNSVWLRMLFFLFVLGKDLPVSFIPLRMGELLGGEKMSPALMGLPVSVEVIMAAASIMLAGFWMRRSGMFTPMICGLSLAVLGNFASFSATDPWMFILSRGLVGAGYGLMLLPAQVEAIKAEKLTYLFAGLYGGSLCGSALGGMLADFMGFTPVFGIAALTLLPLMLLLFLFRYNGEGSLPAKIIPSRRGVFTLFASPTFLALLFFSLLPAAFLEIGIMNYFLPVFLYQAGVSQADIGRVFMLYCLTLIYAGPLAEKIIHARRADHDAVVLGCLFCSAAASSFLLLPPFAASLTGAVCMGLAACCNIPGQSRSLLRLKAAKNLGTEFSMSVLNTTERIGQVAGPLCIGTAFAAVSIAGMALVGSLGTLLAGCAFWISVRMAEKERTT